MFEGRPLLGALASLPISIAAVGVAGAATAAVGTPVSWLASGNISGPHDGLQLDEMRLPLLIGGGATAAGASLVAWEVGHNLKHAIDLGGGAAGMRGFLGGALLLTGALYLGVGAARSIGFADGYEKT